MSGHTPGEWDWGPASGTQDALMRPARVFVVAGGTSRDIAEVGLDRIGEANANARLIAAAPEMLGALESLALMAETDPELSDMARIARAAIAKAEGRQP